MAPKASKSAVKSSGKGLAVKRPATANGPKSAVKRPAGANGRASAVKGPSSSDACHLPPGWVVKPGTTWFKSAIKEDRHYLTGPSAVKALRPISVGSSCSGLATEVLALKHILKAPITRKFLCDSDRYVQQAPPFHFKFHSDGPLV